MEDTNHIFISYSRRDGEQHAVRLETKLQEAGFKTWRDVRGIDPDKDFTAEIETAIEDASHVLVCVTHDSKRSDSYVRREIQYALVLRKPVLPLRFVEIPPHVPIITFEWLEFFRDWEVAFVRLCAIVRGKAHDFISQKSGDDPFRPYLETLYKRIVRFLDQAVIKLIDLTPEDTPDAVNAPPRRKDMLDLFFEAQGIGGGKPTTPKPFHTFAEAFEYYEGRVLLLGEPGAGKTITLFAFARDAVARRLNDVNAPLPLLALISYWDAEKQTPLAEWLAEGYPELDKEIVATRIDSGQTLLLLDGLDELGGERNKTLSKTEYERWNEKTQLSHVIIKDDKNEQVVIQFDPRKRFIEQIPKINQVLVTCRVQDYQEIGKKIGLSGAATLRPLNAKQMQLYLEKQPELWAAVQKDKGLREMLQTPLLLSFFAFAYKGMNIKEREQLSDLSKTPGTLRNKIFENYVRERFEHEERKWGRKLAYDYPTMHRVLGLLAIWDIHYSWRENQIYREDIQTVLADEPTKFIKQCQQLHLLVNLDGHTLRFIHLRLRDYFAVEPLIHTLNDSYRWNRTKAINALVAIADERAIKPLINTLRDVDASVRREAAWGLGHIADERAIKPLIHMLLEDVAIEVKESAITALYNIGEKSIDPLIAVLNSNEDQRIKGTIAWVLERFGTSQAMVAVRKWREERGKQQ